MIRRLIWQLFRPTRVALARFLYGHCHHVPKVGPGVEVSEWADPKNQGRVIQVWVPDAAYMLTTGSRVRVMERVHREQGTAATALQLVQAVLDEARRRRSGELVL